MRDGRDPSRTRHARLWCDAVSLDGLHAPPTPKSPPTSDPERDSFKAGSWFPVFRRLPHDLHAHAERGTYRAAGEAEKTMERFYGRRRSYRRPCSNAHRTSKSSSCDSRSCTISSRCRYTFHALGSMARCRRRCQLRMAFVSFRRLPFDLREHGDDGVTDGEIVADDLLRELGGLHRAAPPRRRWMVLDPQPIASAIAARTFPCHEADEVHRRRVEREDDRCEHHDGGPAPCLPSSSRRGGRVPVRRTTRTRQ